jgi:hypothetical protein
MAVDYRNLCGIVLFIPWKTPGKLLENSWKTPGIL